MLAAAGLNENVLGRGADIRALIRLRALRNQFMPADWFSDPAWDLLLYLYKAHIDREELTVGDLIDRTGLKATTASRWLDSLAVRAWVNRHRCELDHRRVLIELTSKGITAMDGYFDALRDIPV